MLEIEAINWWDACAIHGISAMMSHCDIILHSLSQILASKVPNLQNREINIHTHIFSSPIPRCVADLINDKLPLPDCETQKGLKS